MVSLRLADQLATPGSFHKPPHYFVVNHSRTRQRFMSSVTLFVNTFDWPSRFCRLIRFQSNLESFAFITPAGIRTPRQSEQLSLP